MTQHRTCFGSLQHDEKGDVELTRVGYTVARNAPSFDVAAVHGVEVRPDGSLHGGADPGHDEMALAV